MSSKRLWVSLRYTGSVRTGSSLQVKRICKKRQIELTFWPRMIGVSARKPMSAAAVISEPVESGPALALPPFFWLKRWIDIAGSLALIALLFPLLVLADVVLLAVGSPVFFWQDRLGRQ